MDWNHDGKVDGHDMVHFHEVINSDNNDSPTGCNFGHLSTGSSNTDFGWLGKLFIALLIFEFVSFLAKIS